MKKNKLNKTIELKTKNKEKYKYKPIKTIEAINSVVGNITKINSKIYNTHHIYINKNFNYIKENKLYRVKLKNIMNEVVEMQKINIIKRKNGLNKILKIKGLKTSHNFNHLMKINSFQYYKNIVKSKLLPNSKSDFISTLLYRDNKKSIIID